MSNLTSLIALKSELNKHKLEIQSKVSSQTKDYSLYSCNKTSVKIKPITKEPPNNNNNKINNNNKRNFVENPTFVEEELYKKSKLNLEKKSIIYEKLLLNKKEIPKDNEFLVDFESKRVEKINDNDENNFKSIIYNDFNNRNENQYDIDNNEPLSDLHYTSVLNTEIREHGTGFYRFSSNLEEREQQMKELKKFQKEIINEQQILKKSIESNSNKLQSRLNKIKEKYSAADVSVDDLLPISVQPIAVDSSDDTVAESKINKSIDDLLFELRPDSKNKISRREWDRGKTTVTYEKVKDKLRKERPLEFAPPKRY